MNVLILNVSSIVFVFSIPVIFVIILIAFKIFDELHKS